MKITVIWEDSRGVQTKGFGPHDLLVACIADKPNARRPAISSRIVPVPKNGAGNVIRALRNDLPRLAKVGPVFAVIDRDKARRLFDKAATGPDCMSDIKQKVEKDVGRSDYDLVFLIRNVESLVEACLNALGRQLGLKKPTPDERDRAMGPAVWDANPATRVGIMNSCPSFARLVERVSAALSPSSESPGPSG